jgi:hypothetical protein
MSAARERGIRVIDSPQEVGEEMLSRHSSEHQDGFCPECRGTGTVTHWTEVAYFDDRRSCTRCPAGRDLDARIGEIIARSMRQEIVRR